MFVIMQSWNNAEPSIGKEENLVQKFGKTLGRSGVAITVTSLTDVMAFGIGASTVIFSCLKLFETSLDI
jgi:Niemann-Pick C1 protein